MDTSFARRRPGVLVVDDEPLLLGLFDRVLTTAGFAIWTASSGEAAAEAMARHPDEFDAALIDLRMPGMGGLETVAALKHLKPDLRCCVMGAYLGPAEDIVASGAEAVLQKPFSVNEATRCVRSLLSH